MCWRISLFVEDKSKEIRRVFLPGTLKTPNIETLSPQTFSKFEIPIRNPFSARETMMFHCSARKNFRGNICALDREFISTVLRKKKSAPEISNELYIYIYVYYVFYQGYSTKMALGIYAARQARGHWSWAMPRAEISASELHKNKSVSVGIETDLFGGQILIVPTRFQFRDGSLSVNEGWYDREGWYNRRL